MVQVETRKVLTLQLHVAQIHVAQVFRLHHLVQLEARRPELEVLEVMDQPIKENSVPVTRVMQQAPLDHEVACLADQVALTDTRRQCRQLVGPHVVQD